MSGLDGMDGLDGLSYTTVTPRASLQSDANNPQPSNNRFLKNSNKLPVQGGTLLNSINEKVSYFNVHTSNVAIIQGLLSYTDFHFLLLLMSTPTRYLDIIFRGFDISADGNVEAKVVFNAHNGIKLHQKKIFFILKQMLKQS